METPRPLGTAAMALLLLSAGVAWSALGPVDRRSDGEIGTIRAVVDGEERTWYVLEGTVAGQFETSALWMDFGDGRAMVVVGGYDRVDVPFETFERDPNTGMVTSYGAYRGDVLTVNFPVRSGAAAPVSFSVGEVDDASVLYIPSMDFSGMLALQSGRIHVKTIDWDRGRFRGTFEGELRTVDGSRTARVTSGTFEVDGARSLSEIRSGGR